MVIQNQSTEEGDILHFSTDVPILGIILLNSFADGTYIATPGSDFDKQFRYSLDGGNSYTDWIPLTIPNVQAIPTNMNLPFVCDYMYTHTGVDADSDTGGVYFNWVELTGEGVDTGTFPIYGKTDFEKYFPIFDTEVIQWAYNVMEKLYTTGIIPTYIRRDCPSGPEDYSIFYLSITHLFAILVKMARLFRKMNSQEEQGGVKLFNKFIESRGLVIRDADLENSLVYDYIFKNWKSEYSKRGTDSIVEKKEGENNLSGEFLRLINYQDYEEFMFFNLVRQDLGWNLDYSSPMWTGCEQIVNAIKEYEKLPQLTMDDLSQYPTIGTVTKTVDSSGKAWLQFGKRTIDGDGMTVAGEVCGIEVTATGSANKSEYIPVSPDLSYEILFEIKIDFQKTSSRENPLINMDFGVYGYDENGNKLTFTSGKRGLITNSFFLEPTPNVNIYPNGQGMIMRGVVLAADQLSYDGRNLNFTNGAPLIMNVDTRFITPYITQNMSGEGVCPISITGLRIFPKDLSIERGYLGSITPIVSYFYNRSGNSDDYIQKFTEQYLIPVKWGFLLSTYLQEVVIVTYNLIVNLYLDGVKDTSLSNMVSVEPSIAFNQVNTFQQSTPIDVSIRAEGDYLVDNVVPSNNSIVVSNTNFSFPLNSNTTIDIYFIQAFIILYVYGHGKLDFSDCVLINEGAQISVKFDDEAVITGSLTDACWEYGDGDAYHRVVITSHTLSEFNFDASTRDFKIISANFSTDNNITSISLNRNQITNDSEYAGISVSGLTALQKLSITNDTGLSQINLSYNEQLREVVLTNDYRLQNITLGLDQVLTDLNVSVENYRDPNIQSLSIAYNGGSTSQPGVLDLSQITCQKVTCSKRDLNTISLPAGVQTVIADHNLFSNLPWQEGLTLVDYSYNPQVMGVNWVAPKASTNADLTFYLDHCTLLSSIHLENFSEHSDDKPSSLTNCGGENGVDIYWKGLRGYLITDWTNTKRSSIYLENGIYAEDYQMSIENSADTLKEVTVINLSIYFGGFITADEWYTALTSIHIEDSKNVGNFNPGDLADYENTQNVLQTFYIDTVGANAINLMPYCKTLVSFESFGNALQSLGMPWVHETGVVMEKLETLSIKGSSSGRPLLYTLNSPQRPFVGSRTPALKTIIFNGWKDDTEIYNLEFQGFPALQQLNLDNVDIQRLTITNCLVLTEVSGDGNVSLINLTLTNLPSLESYPIASYESLQNLTLTNVAGDILYYGMRDCPLVDVRIENCPDLNASYIYGATTDTSSTTLKTIYINNCPSTTAGPSYNTVFEKLTSFVCTNSRMSTTFYIPNSKAWATVNSDTYYHVDVSNNNLASVRIASVNKGSSASIGIKASNNRISGVSVEDGSTLTIRNLDVSDNSSLVSLSMSDSKKSRVQVLLMNNCTSYSSVFTTAWTGMRIFHISNTRVSQLQMDGWNNLEDFEYYQASALSSIQILSQSTNIDGVTSFAASDITVGNVINQIYEDLLSKSANALQTFILRNCSIPFDYQGWSRWTIDGSIYPYISLLDFGGKTAYQVEKIDFSGCTLNTPSIRGSSAGDYYVYVEYNTAGNALREVNLSNVKISPALGMNYTYFLIVGSTNNQPNIEIENFQDSDYVYYYNGNSVHYDNVHTINIAGSWGETNAFLFYVSGSALPSVNQGSTLIVSKDPPSDAVATAIRNKGFTNIQKI